MPRGASYGNNVNALALSLLNDSNVSYNKVVKHICGISNGEINLTEGYLVKLQKKSADKLNNFIQDLKRKILTLDKVHWDDTVVKIQSETENRNGKKIKEGYIRFYGDDSFALLIGHKKKDKESITEDGILPYLSENCTCIHDHVLLNYNEEYKFKNAECNSHILRYLKGVKDNLHDHIWQDKMSDLLKEMNNKRDEYISTKVKSFTNEEIESYYTQYEEIIKLGYEENSKTKDYHFYKEDEKNLIERLDKYKDNHLLFIKDFTVPFTNNTAERGLRQTKRKLAVSFLFKNTSTMEDYAKIISYLETCYRNEITWNDYTESLVINNNGNIYLKYGFNEEETETETIVEDRIDRSIPTVSVETDGGDITLTMSDVGSGLASYCINTENDSSTCTFTNNTNSSVQTTLEESGTYYAFSKDAAGNISTGYEFEVDIPISAGTAIYLDPTTGNRCTNYISANSTTGYSGGTTETQNGCMKWYIFKEEGNNYYAILDHNTTAKVKYNSSGSNTTANEAATQLATDTANWVSDLSPRFITADEIAVITGADQEINWSSSTKAYDQWYYFDGTSNNMQYRDYGTNDFAWLFDYTYNCRTANCNVADNTTYGYWTSSIVYNSNTYVWVVSYGGSVSGGVGASTNGYGIRPVITVAK